MHAFFSIRIRAIQVRNRFIQSAIGALAVLAALTTGCSKGTTLSLQTMMDTTVTSPVNSISDGWSSSNLTPTGFAIGLQSAKLTCCQPSNTSGSPASFTIFDQETGAPLFTRLYNSPTKVTISSKSDIANGTYDQLELQVVYYEAAIQAMDNTGQPHTRRLRSYFQNYNEPLITSATNAADTAVSPFDQLLSYLDFTVPTSNSPTDVGTSDGTDLRWINQSDGGPCFPRTSCTDTSNTSNAPYQGNSGLFAGYPTVTIPIPAGQEITVDSNTDAAFVVNFTAGVQNLFFYDETDSSAPNTTAFNYQYLSTPALSKDGTIQKACSTADCGTNPKTADFWIGPPTYSLFVTSQ